MSNELTSIDLLMVNIYVNLIRVKKRTLESVPEKIRGLVKDKLIELGIYYVEGNGE